MTTSFARGVVVEATEQTKGTFHRKHGWGGIEESSSCLKMTNWKRSQLHPKAATEEEEVTDEEDDE
jgi:hypothetical protein